MSEPSQNPDLPKSDPPQKSDVTKPGPLKKLEARTAGAPNTNEDVFKLDDFPGAEPGAAHTPLGEEEKIGITEALRIKGIKDLAKAARRKSGQILTMFGGKKDSDKKDEDKNDEDKNDEDKNDEDKNDEDKNDEDKNDGSKDGGSNTNTV